jgi:ABC-type branched-subunit amino acid transport system substrate-binding protein
VADESYGEGDTNFSAQLTKIKSRDAQGIFVPGYYTEIGLIARQARQLGLTLPLLGAGSWESPRLLEIGGEALEGSYYFGHFSPDDPRPAVQDFVRAYKSRFGQIPDAFAALAFDATGVLVDAIGRANSTDPGKIRDALARRKITRVSPARSASMGIAMRPNRWSFYGLAKIKKSTSKLLTLRQLTQQSIEQPRKSHVCETALSRLRVVISEGE